MLRPGNGTEKYRSGEHKALAQAMRTFRFRTLNDSGDNSVRLVDFVDEASHG